MKRLIVFSIFFLFALMPYQQASAASIPSNKVLKISITDANQDLFYAYVAPDHFFYRVGHEEISGPEAEKQVTHMIEALRLSPDTTVKELTERLKPLTDSHLTYFDVRWIDGSDHLYTWVWRKSD